MESIIQPCESCDQLLRIPTNHGAIMVTCPKCRWSFDWPKKLAPVPVLFDGKQQERFAKLAQGLERQIKEESDEDHKLVIFKRIIHGEPKAVKAALKEHLKKVAPLVYERFKQNPKAEEYGSQATRTKPQPRPAPVNAIVPQLTASAPSPAQPPSPKVSAPKANVSDRKQTASIDQVFYAIGAVCVIVVMAVLPLLPRQHAPEPQYSVPYSANAPDVQYNKPPPTGDVSVRGYRRANGTYVEPHYRSQQNGMPQDNFSASGNVNPYTGKPGTK